MHSLWKQDGLTRDNMQNKSRKGQETLNTDDTSPSRIQMEEATTRASAMVYRTDRRPGSVFNLIMDSVPAVHSRAGITEG